MLVFIHMDSVSVSISVSIEVSQGILRPYMLARLDELDYALMFKLFTMFMEYDEKKTKRDGTAPYQLIFILLISLDSRKTLSYPNPRFLPYLVEYFQKEFPQHTSEIMASIRVAGLQERWNFFPRNSALQMRYCVSFVFRNIKLLAQIKITVVCRTFNAPDDTNLIPVISCYTKVGRLSLQLYREKRKYRFNGSISPLEQTVMENVEKVCRFDLSTFQNTPSFDKFHIP
ncbi:hypothetical protein EDC96DRAFT_547037 [Choanephora cucurbitarum]|nr:hypothetical protein EDC96DRAFT_547037 [Choanephora cucurbitarum]